MRVEGRNQVGWVSSSLGWVACNVPIVDLPVPRMTSAALELSPAPPPTLKPLVSSTPTTTPMHTSMPAAGTSTLVAQIPTTAAQATASAQAGPQRPGWVFDFERDFTWRRGDEQYGQLSRSSEQVKAGSASGRLQYDFPAVANNYVVFTSSPPLEIPGQASGITAWVYGDGAGHFLNAWVQDADGEIRSYTFGQVRHQGWQEMTAWLDEKHGWPNGHISGPDDGRLKYPILLSALVLDGVPDGQASSGVIYLDDLYSIQDAIPAPSPTQALTMTPMLTPAPITRFLPPSTPPTSPAGPARTVATATPTIPAETYYRVVPKHSGKCLGIEYDSRENSARVVQYDCLDADNQRWSFTPEGDYYRIRPKHSNKCLGIEFDSRENSAVVVQYECLDADNQRWKLVSEGDYYRVMPKHSGKCLGVEFDSRANSALVVQYQCLDADNQRWSLIPAR